MTVTCGVDLTSGGGASCAGVSLGRGDSHRMERSHPLPVPIGRYRRSHPSLARRRLGLSPSGHWDV